MRSLGTRLALVLAMVLFALMVLAGFWIERQLTRAIYDEDVNQAEIHAKTLLASLQTLMLNGQGTLARQWLDRMKGAEGIADIQVLRTSGEEAFTDLDTVNSVNTFLAVPRFAREPVAGRGEAVTNEAAWTKAVNGSIAFDTGESTEITVFMPIPTQTECLACHGYDPSLLRGVLKLSLSTDLRERRVSEMRQSLWVIAFILVLVLSAALLLTLRVNVLAPINLLREAINRVGQGDRDARLPVEWKDELGEVAQGFNRMQRSLHAIETRIRSVMDNVMEAIIIIDERGLIESVNPAALEIFGYSAHELVGQNVSILMPEPYKSMHNGYIEKYLRTGKGNILGRRATEFVGIRKSGDTFPLELGLSEMRTDDQRHFIGVVRDITERKKQSAAIEHQALHDSLTDLPNRSLLADRLKQAVLRSQRNKDQFALLLMDLDHFKEINDTLGHHYGDLILQQVAKRMRESLRESDTVARLGGDEFAVLLNTSDKDHAVQVAEKLLKSLDRPFILEGQSLHVGGSIGIALFPEHGEDEVTLLRLADVAMYVAKRATRGYALYDPAKDEHNPRTLALLGDLRNAIDLDELVLFYQPKVDLRSERVHAVEALVRWRHPEHGLMLPDEFVPLAEQTGLIKPLTLWVLKEALRQQTQWRHEGWDLDMAVNMSVRNLQDMQFPERVAKIVDAMGRSPNKLFLEITETAIMADPRRAHEVLGDLDDMKVRLSIDDFGTGHSSLAYLRQLPVKEIKIDKSFVTAMDENDNDAVIVRSIIDLAHNVGMAVIAEGVETEQTYRRLKNLGADAVQGFYISEPLSADDFVKWLSTCRWPVRNPV